MTRIIDLPNPFESAPEAGRPAAAAFVPQPRAAAVGISSPEVEATIAPGMAPSEFESRAKATKGNAGMAEAAGLVRRSTAGTGLQVGEAGADLPTTSEFMDVTARRDEQPNSRMHRAGRTTASPNNAMAAENARETIPARSEGGSVRHVGAGESPATNSDVIDIPAFLKRNPDNTFRFPSA